MYSNSVLKRFVKDYSLPIQIVREPYFTYYLELYDPYLNTKEKYRLFCETVQQLGGEQNFLDQYHKIKEDILNSIKGTDIFKKFNDAKLDEYNVPQNAFCKHDIFNMANIGKCFVSIDLKKANFSAMKHYNKDLVLGFECYEYFMRNFTELDYMIESKYIRQVIFGNLNPKKQIKIQQYLTYNILEFLLKSEYLEKESIRMVSADEIVFETNMPESFEDKVLTQKIKDMFDLNVDIEVYQLENIKPFSFFVKEFKNKPGQELMCIPVVYFAQAYKKYFGLELNDYDLCFWYENQIAQFLKPLEEMECENDECKSDIYDNEN